MADVMPIVYVVDDDISVREALEALIRDAGWRPFVFASAREFLSQPLPSLPSCLVLDISLPDFNGLDLQQQLAAARNDMPIIFITGYGDVPMSVRAMKAGALEFLIKPFEEEVLRETIRGAIQRSAAALGREAELRILRERHALLSNREREVMALIVSGLMNKQVGGKLGISEITVKAHRGRVMRKMGAVSFADLIYISAKLDIMRNS
jgi:FixJ family two-component response regulator